MESKETDFSNDILEKLLLKRCLTDKKSLDRVSRLYDRRWIEDDNVRNIFSMVLSYYKKYTEIPNNRVIEALSKKFTEKHPDIDLGKLNSTLNEVGNMNLGISEDVLKRNLQSFIEAKGMFWTISDNIKQIEEDKNVDKCIDRFNAIRKMTFEDADLGMNYFRGDDQKKHWEYIMNPEAKIKTLWEGLDNYTNGGFLKDGKDLVCFCGQAGLGKSLFLSNLAVNFLKQNLSVVVISLEMSQDVYAKRFDAHISGDNVNTLNRTKDESLKRIDEFYKKYPQANLFIKEYPPRTIRVSDIENYLDNLKANGFGFDAIIIDYLNLVLPNNKSDNMYESVLSVAEKLRALSYKYEAPVITATQATTQGMNNENIGMEHISESRGIAHTVDELFMLFQMDEDREHGEINMRIAKNRAGGQVGKIIKFKMNPENLRLEDETFIVGGSNSDDTSESDRIIENISHMDDDIGGF